MKEIRNHTNRWKNVSCSWIGRIGILTMIMLPKAIYRYNAIPVKLPMSSFIELKQKKKKKTLKFILKHSKPWIAQVILKKKNGARAIRILEWVTFPFPRASPQTRDWTQSHSLQSSSLPAEPQGKPKNNGVGSLSFSNPDPGFELESLALKADSLTTELSGKP